MIKRKIKIVKRDAPAHGEAVVSKPNTDPNRSMTNTVKDWISERRENSRHEKASNDRVVVGWKNIPDANAG